jgi:Family of unknown function (DUF5686)
LNPLLDTCTITQTLDLVRNPDSWAMRTQVFGFNFGIMGFKYKGVFTSVFSDYLLEKQEKPKFFNAEEFRMLDHAANKNDTLWQDTRPIPLTREEERDYHRKDSIALAHSSKAWLDSIDNKRNRFKPFDLITGYTWQNSWQHSSFRYAAPLNTVGFNTVQGLNFGTELEYKKAKDEQNTHFWSIGAQMRYGISDKTPRGNITATKKFNAIHNDQISVTLAGREAVKYNDAFPIPPFINTFMSLFQRRNDIKLYERDQIKVQYSRRLSHLFQLNMDITGAARRPLVNKSAYAFPNAPGTYSSNNPALPLNDKEAFDTHNAFGLSTKLTWYPAATYSSYPARVHKLKCSDLFVYAPIYVV